MILPMGVAKASSNWFRQRLYWPFIPKNQRLVTAKTHEGQHSSNKCKNALAFTRAFVVVLLRLVATAALRRPPAWWWQAESLCPRAFRQQVLSRPVAPEPQLPTEHCRRPR